MPINVPHEQGAVPDITSTPLHWTLPSVLGFRSFICLPLVLRTGVCNVQEYATGGFEQPTTAPCRAPVSSQRIRIGKYAMATLVNVLPTLYAHVN